jgi:hypothetical protein
MIHSLTDREEPERQDERHVRKLKGKAPVVRRRAGNYLPREHALADKAAYSNNVAVRPLRSVSLAADMQECAS